MFAREDLLVFVFFLPYFDICPLGFFGLFCSFLLCVSGEDLSGFVVVFFRCFDIFSFLGFLVQSIFGFFWFILIFFVFVS